MTISFRSFNVFLFFLLISINLVEAQEAQQRRLSFDEDWKFALGDEQSAQTSAFDDSKWRKLDLPHDWSIEGQISPKHPMAGDGGFFPAGTAWYRKTFEVPAKWNGQQISIHFDGVYMNSEVYLNGVSLGKYPYGYSAFSYDLTKQLRYGEKNIISVRVDNSQQKNCRWYMGSGIYRHVWMDIVPPLNIAHWGVFVTTPELSSSKALVEVKVNLKNQSTQNKVFQLQTELLDQEGHVKASGVSKIELAAGAVRELPQQIRMSKPKLWSPENPHLYQARIRLLEGKKILDESYTEFGVRSIAFSTTKGFELNGKSLKLNGGCVHHDNGSLGAAAYDRAEERKVELLKAAGFNAVRTAHNLPSEAFLRACDRLGMLVIDEAFDGWRSAKNKYDYSVLFDQWWQRDLEAMVLRDRNHPSIIMWSIGNEIIERKDPQAVETAKMLAAHVRKLDASRPVTSAMTTWDKDWEIFDPLMAAHDVAGYNYQLHRAEADHQRVPSRIMVQTESYPRDAFKNWKLVKEHPYILGDFVWTAMDYLGESGIGRWYYSGEAANFHSSSELFPWHGAYCGDIDLLGWRKPISHYRSLLYNGKEPLYMAVREPEPKPLEIKETDWSVWPTWESWTWPGYEGKPIQVELYSRYPKVRLYLNDQLIGEKDCGEAQEFKAIFDVPYAAGGLYAVGVQGKEEVGRVSLKTAGAASRIHLKADRSNMMANGQDLIYVTVEVSDKDGNLQPNADNRLSFELEGPGSIVAVDNGDLKDVDPYVAGNRKVWKGRALVIIKSTKQAGHLVLKASSAGLSAQEIKLESRVMAK